MSQKAKVHRGPLAECVQCKSGKVCPGCNSQYTFTTSSEPGYCSESCEPGKFSKKNPRPSLEESYA